MKVSAFARLAAAAGFAIALASSAHATIWGWQYTNGVNPGGSNVGINNNGGTVQTINAQFDDATKRLTFDVLFSGVTNGGPLVTNGFWLVLNDGPNPKNKTGELAILYFDASRVFAGTDLNPRLSVYEYNGKNNNSSWTDGNGDGVGGDAALIKGIYEGASFINSISAQDVTIAGQQRRRLRLDIDASSLVNRIPTFPSPGVQWHGTGFDDKLGLWFHPAQIFNASYEAKTSTAKGRITSLSVQGEGWIDGSDFTTFIVPAPSSAALLGLGALVATRRRR